MALHAGRWHSCASVAKPSSHLQTSSRKNFWHLQCSRASARCWRATLAGIPAAPILLRSAPTCHPIGKTSVAIVRCACGSNWCASIALSWATLAMNTAAPLLLANRPAHQPILEAIGAIVRVCWRRRHGNLTTEMVMLAAPVLLDRRPSWVNTNGAIERNLGRNDWPLRSSDRRWRGCWRRRWRWRWRRCRLWGWDCQQCGCTADVHGAAAEVLLLLRPDCGGCWRCDADGAIEDTGCSWP